MARERTQDAFDKSGEVLAATKDKVTETVASAAPGGAAAGASAADLAGPVQGRRRRRGSPPAEKAKRTPARPAYCRHTKAAPTGLAFSLPHVVRWRARG